MKVKVEFFKDEFCDAVGAGVYEIIVSKNGKSAPLYVGESVVVLARCATHLFRLKSDPSYFGFQEDTIEDENITLKFTLCEFPRDRDKEKKEDRREIERNRITNEKPLTQSETSDKQKSKADKISALNDFLDSCKQGLDK